LIKRHWKEWIAGSGLLAVLAVVLVASQAVPYAVAANTSATDQKIIHYVRERFGIPNTTKLTVAPFQDSEYSDFYQTTISVLNGEKKSTQLVLITKDGNYMVIGDVFVASSTVQHDLAANASVTDQKIVDYVRTKFHVPDTIKLSVGPFRDSEYSDFYQTTIYGQNGEKRSAQPAFVTKDGRYTVIGSIFNLNADPRREVEHTISMNDQPTVGPAKAPVTIVEYADLECPTCAEMHKFFAQQLIPKYGNKIRIVFKEFPLVTIHDWALTAAIANECAYQLNPADFFRYRSTIFESQEMINAANVRTLLLDFGQRAGLSRLKLATCLDSKASLPRVEADMREGQQLGIMSTPTLFINGTPVVGLSPDRIYQMIDQALQAVR
jgi:protein-disulfide isomerase